MRGRNGFTLLELLVVLVLLALATLAVPGLFSGLAGVQLRAAGDRMVVLMHDAQLHAVQLNQTVEFYIHPSTQMWHLGAEQVHRPLPSGFDTIEVTPPERKRGEYFLIVFHPDGTATEARIVLRDARRTVAIRIDPFTGPRRDD